MMIATPHQAAAVFRQSVPLNPRRGSNTGASVARVPPPRVQLPAPQVPRGATASSMAGLVDDFECGIAQAEQRVKGILIGLLVGAAATAFFMARR